MAFAPVGSSGRYTEVDPWESFVRLSASVRSELDDFDRRESDPDYTYLMNEQSANPDWAMRCRPFGMRQGRPLFSALRPSIVPASNARSPPN